MRQLPIQQLIQAAHQVPLGVECVAEVLHLPIYRVSGSNLGSNAREIEQRSINAFDSTARWGGILLLDEAEEFMAKRGDDSLEKNTMVESKECGSRIAGKLSCIRPL